MSRYTVSCWLEFLFFIYSESFLSHVLRNVFKKVVFVKIDVLLREEFFSGFIFVENEAIFPFVKNLKLKYILKIKFKENLFVLFFSFFLNQIH